MFFLQACKIQIPIFQMRDQGKKGFENWFKNVPGSWIQPGSPRVKALSLSGPFFQAKLQAKHWYINCCVGWTVSDLVYMTLQKMLDTTFFPAGRIPLLHYIYGNEDRYWFKKKIRMNLRRKIKAMKYIVIQFLFTKRNIQENNREKIKQNNSTEKDGSYRSHSSSCRVHSRFKSYFRRSKRSLHRQTFEETLWRIPTTSMQTLPEFHQNPVKRIHTNCAVLKNLQ